MRKIKEELRKDKRYNFSSLGCDDCSFANFSGNNDSDIVWRQWRY